MEENGRGAQIFAGRQIKEFFQYLKGFIRIRRTKFITIFIKISLKYKHGQIITEKQ